MLTSPPSVTSISFCQDTSGGQLTSIRKPAAVPVAGFTQGRSSRIGLPFPLNGRPHRNRDSSIPQPLFSASTPKSIVSSCCIVCYGSLPSCAPRGRSRLRPQTADRQRPRENCQHSRPRAGWRIVRKNRNLVSGNSPTSSSKSATGKAARMDTPHSTSPGARHIARSQFGSAGRAFR